MKYARIINNVAVETFTPPQNRTLAECWHPTVAALFQQVPDTVQANWKLVNGTWTAPASD